MSEQAAAAAAAPVVAAAVIDTAAPASAPASAPAAPAQAAPLSVTDPVEPSPAQSAAEENVVVQYQPTGDAGLDVALAFVGARGFRPEHPGLVAATKGDFAPLEAALKELGDKAKGYEPYLASAKDSFTRRQTETQATAKAAQEAVVKAVGGVEAWNELHAWVKANADETEKKQINAAFSAGGVAAAAMASHLQSIFKQSGAQKGAPAAVVKETASAGTVSADTAPLAPAEYSRAYGKLRAQFGGRVESTPEYAALRQRAQAYKG